MSRFLRFSLFAVTLFNLGNALADDSINSVVVKGNYRIDSESILSVINSKAGSTLDTSVIQSDIKAIYRLGFFDSVEADKTETSSGVVLTYIIHERPAIKEIRFSGNDEFSNDTLKEKLNLEARKFLDKRKIQASIDELKKYYQEEGYYGTKIKYESEELKAGEVILTFKIEEGEKKVIKKISFLGNKALDEDDLDEGMGTSTYSWLWSWATGSGVVKKEVLEQDTRVLQHTYLVKGYADIKVSEPEIKEIEDGLEVVFSVEEGEKYKFGKIDASGTLLEGGAKETLKDIKTLSGETFNVDLLREDVFKITDKFTDIGFAFANVDPMTKIDRDKKLVDVSYAVDKGDKITINRINVVGNDKTQDNVIRRNLRMHEQEIYSSSKIKRSQELLRRLGFFDEVTISPEKTDKPGEVDLSVAVKEAMTGQFTAGAGVSSGDGFIITSKISENNLMGTGNSLSLDINSGQLRQNYILSFQNPRVNDSFFSFGADAAVTQRNFEDFLRRQNGGSVSTGYPLWFLGEELRDDVRATLGYELMQNEITDIDDDVAQLVRDQEGKYISSAIIPGLTRSTIDNPLDPNKGSRQVLRMEYAGVGGDQKYWLGTARNSWYYPIAETSFGNIVFSQRTQFGWGESINGDSFPLFQRFFPGGINSLRGFDAREVGPKDENGNYFGGNKQLIMNFEMIFPLIPSIGLNGVGFYDMGNAYDDSDNIGFDTMRKAVGWGVRWRSPLAPIRIEVGYPLDKEEGEKSMVTNFSFGAPL
jgi:outer membrane protein insertion porin family